MKQQYILVRTVDHCFRSGMQCLKATKANGSEGVANTLYPPPLWITIHAYEPLFPQSQKHTHAHTHTHTSSPRGFGGGGATLLCGGIPLRIGRISPADSYLTLNVDFAGRFTALQEITMVAKITCGLHKKPWLTLSITLVHMMMWN